jgi:hypothetical protein
VFRGKTSGCSHQFVAQNCGRREWFEPLALRALWILPQVDGVKKAKKLNDFYNHPLDGEMQNHVTSPKNVSTFFFQLEING